MRESEGRFLVHTKPYSISTILASRYDRDGAAISGIVFKDPSALKNIFSSANSDFDVSCAKERGFENLGKGMTRCVTVS